MKNKNDQSSIFSHKLNQDQLNSIAAGVNGTLDGTVWGDNKGGVGGSITVHIPIG